MVCILTFNLPAILWPLEQEYTLSCKENVASPSILMLRFFGSAIRFFLFSG